MYSANRSLGTPSSLDRLLLRVEVLVSSDAVQRCFHPCTTEKLFGIYFGGYTADISGDFVSSFKELERAM